MTKLTSLIQELEELEKKATPGPWKGEKRVVVYGIYSKHELMNARWGNCICWMGGKRNQVLNENRMSNMNLIAHSRNALPKLLQCLRVLSEALEYYSADNVLWSDDTLANEYASCTIVREDSGMKADQALEKCEEIINAV